MTGPPEVMSPDGALPLELVYFDSGMLNEIKSDLIKVRCTFRCRAKRQHLERRKRRLLDNWRKPRPESGLDCLLSVRSTAVLEPLFLLSRPLKRYVFAIASS